MSLENLTLFVNTHSSAEDCWPMFFGQLEKHWPSHPPLVWACDVADNERPRPIGVASPPNRWVQYDSSAPFGQQYLQGLAHVTTDYVLPMLEDFILYGDVDEAAIAGLLASFQSDCADRDFIRLIDSGHNYAYSFQASLWKTDSLLRITTQARRLATPWEFEVGICNSEIGRSIHGIMVPGNTPRGNHADWKGFPYIATALRRGKWNLSEYPEELGRLLKEYDIDPSIRGTV